MTGPGRWIRHNVGLSLALALFAGLYVLYNALHPRGFSIDLLVQNANESLTLVLVAMAQTVPVLLGSIDLSVGPLMTLVDCIGSHVLAGSPGEIALGMLLCLAAGALGGFVNGCLVVYGRIQSIVATLATGAVFVGLALLLRPTPGGTVDGDLSWVTTNALTEMAGTYGWFPDGAPAWFAPLALIPVPIVIAAAIVLLVWVPFRSTVTGRGCYAVGSSESAAYLSGVPVDRAKLAAFTLGGLFAGFAGLYFALQTGSGNADPQQAGQYTLNSIAAVVIGGTSLFGGSGGAIGSLVGVLVLRSISFFFRVVDTNSPLGFLANPLLQPMFEGIILLLAVCLGAARVFQVKNRLQLFG